MGAKNLASNQATANYGGKTRKEWKRSKGSSTPGKQKGENCHASGLDKAMLKYPRAYKTFPVEYLATNAKKDKADKGRKSLSGGTDLFQLAAS